MKLYVLFLVLAAALLHASWNLLAKKQEEKLRLFGYNMLRVTFVSAIFILSNKTGL
jgi:hypothetical protein